MVLIRRPLLLHLENIVEDDVESEALHPVRMLVFETVPDVSMLDLNMSGIKRDTAAAPVVEKNEVYEECDMPALGTCTALYPFEGGSEGTMAMNEGDEMVLIEKDEGDGWTRVRHISSGREGFVPTSYLQCKWYPDQ